MRRKTVIKILAGIAAFIILIRLVVVMVLEPWVEKKILSALNKARPTYEIRIDEVNTLLLARGVKLQSVTINPALSGRGMKGDIESIEFEGINLIKLIIKNDLDIKKVTISSSSVKGKIDLSKVRHVISTLNMTIERIFLNKVDLDIKNISDSKLYLVKEGWISLEDFKISKDDTIYIANTTVFDFKAGEVRMVSPDSFYTFILMDVNYSEDSDILKAEKVSIQPNYKDYDFTSRQRYQEDRIDAQFRNIIAYHFSSSDYFKNNSLLSSGVQIKSIEMNVFRDRRKPFHHKKKPVLQDLVYNYPGKINIDSIRIEDGNIRYTEHGESSKEAGSIYFKNVDAAIYNITNDTIYKTENAFTEARVEALVMGKAKLIFNLKAKLFDRDNIFFLNGGLAKLDVTDLNQILERNAFIHAESGIIDTMTFNMAGNNIAATGELTLLYNMLFIKVEGEHAIVPASLMQLFISVITSKRIQDANPAAGEGVRKGVIAFERDPEKFIFNYYFKAVLSGIKSSIDKSSKKIER